MKRWETLVDRMVRDVIGDGDISHLPGAHKPLDLDNDHHTPDDMRVTFKIMKDHDVAPDWMMTAQALSQIEAKLCKQLEIRARRYWRQLTEVRRKGAILEEIKIENSWKAYMDDFTDRVGRYNKEVLLYNLKVPENIPHKQILVGEKLIAEVLQQIKGDD